MSGKQSTEQVWLTTSQAAKRLGVVPRTLERLRKKGEGPRFSQRGRLVRYLKTDVDEWMRGSEK